MPKIFRFAIVAAVVLTGATWYIHWSHTRALDSGEVHVHQLPTNTQKPVPAAPPSEAAANEDQNQTPEVASIPTTDTGSRNPPNRTLIAGTGRFELYRQGDITWRMDTATGQACVLFATQNMWRKTLVYEHGCGAS